jgi:GR25 family glycosyltransferase involved in LPS biosynthesis
MEYLKKILFNYNVKLININYHKNTIINEKIQRIFVINLLEDRIKRNYIITVMKKLNINFTLVLVNKVRDNDYNILCPQKNISKEELGCCLSHLFCLQTIIKQNIKNSIIFEDDIIFHKNFLKEFLKIDLENCDFLLLGAHDYSFASVNHQLIKKNNLYHPDKNSTCLYGAHANYYSLNAAKCMFEIRSSLISFFDKEYMLLFNHFPNSSFICYPNLIVTDISNSKLNHAKKYFSLEEKQYYNHCFIHFSFQNYHFIYLEIFMIYFQKKNEIKKITNYSELVNDCLSKNHSLSKEFIPLLKERFSMNSFTVSDIEQIFL